MTAAGRKADWPNLLLGQESRVGRAGGDVRNADAAVLEHDATVINRRVGQLVDQLDVACGALRRADAVRESRRGSSQVRRAGVRQLVGDGRDGTTVFHIVSRTIQGLRSRAATARRAGNVRVTRRRALEECQRQGDLLQVLVRGRCRRRVGHQHIEVHEIEDRAELHAGQEQHPPRGLVFSDPAAGENEVRVVVIVAGQRELLHVILALGAPSRLHGRKEQGDQDRDNRDHDQQFNERELHLADSFGSAAR